MHRVAGYRAQLLALLRLHGDRVGQIVLVMRPRDVADRRFSCPCRADRRALAFGEAQPYGLAKTLDAAGTDFERRLVGDEFRAGVVISIGEQGLDRHIDEFGVAVKGIAVGKCEFCGFHLQVDEVRPGRIQPIETETLAQRELLQGD